MRRIFPIVLSLSILVGLAWVVAYKKEHHYSAVHIANIGEIEPTRICMRLPKFLIAQHIFQPVMIDLSQKRHKGIALLYGKHFAKTLHPKQWEQYGYFSTYTLDNRGNIYLIPTPFISITPTTFSLQKKLYKLDTDTGKLTIFMDFQDVRPSPRNPYGLNAIAYDCRDQSLWVAAIDESDYRMQRGVIYHIDPATKTVTHRLEGVDALSLALAHTTQGAFLLVGSARDNGLYACRITPRGIAPATKLFDLPDPNAHIRKIKIRSKNRMEIQAIPFTYSLIAQASKQDRIYYDVVWNPNGQQWKIYKK